MKHIKTADAAETSMRKLYPLASESQPIVAEDSHVKLIQDILDKTRQIDLLKLEVSKAMGSLMGYMQGHAVLEDSEHKPLITWINGKDKETIDFDGIILEMNIPPNVIAKHTTVKPGARTFTIVAD